VKAKKSLGQHFLKDETIASAIVSRFLETNISKSVLEVGPGMGVLTKYLLRKNDLRFYAIELDERMISYLQVEFPSLRENLFHESILDFDFDKIEHSTVAIIGNFPYNISSQILFKMLEWKEKVSGLTGMFQKEVARRIAAPAGNKEYGILSVLVQAFYETEYLFDVEEKSFSPPPKVKSGVLRLNRKKQFPELKNEDHFFRLVKSGFGKRRKTLKNSLAGLVGSSSNVSDNILKKRAEQLTVSEWIDLSNMLASV
jgi:16S rRNA (adenine1518-N6/adenine1519-N6)-dimethyltransferase